MDAKDVIQLLLEKSDVSDILKNMRVNTRWKTAALNNTIWMSIINTKNFRDLVYSMYQIAKKTKGVWDEFAPVDMHIIAKFIWDIVSEQGRPRLYTINKSVFVTFLFMWKAFPHVFVNDEGQVTHIQSTTYAANQTLRQQNAPFLDDYNAIEDYAGGFASTYETDQVRMLTEFLSNLTPADMLLHNVNVPYLYLTVTDEATLILREISPDLRLRIGITITDNEEDYYYHYLVENNVMRNIDTINGVPSHFNIFVGSFVREERLVNTKVKLHNLQYGNVGLSSPDGPSYVYVFVSYANRASTMLATGVFKNNDDNYQLWWRARIFYNHINILGKAGRIQSCIACEIDSDTMCSKCQNVICDKCFSKHGCF